MILVNASKLQTFGKRSSRFRKNSIIIITAGVRTQNERHILTKKLMFKYFPFFKLCLKSICETTIPNHIRC